MINKIDRPLMRLIKKKREEVQINNEKVNITTDTIDIIKRYEQFYES